MDSPTATATPANKFAKKYDWQVLRPQVAALRAQGLGWSKIAADFNISVKTLYTMCRPKQPKLKGQKPLKDQAPSETNGTLNKGDGLSEDLEALADPSAVKDTESLRKSALRVMAAGIAGTVKVTGSQAALIQQALKLADGADGSKNLFAGIPSEEVAERALVLAVSVCGLPRIADMLKELAKKQTLDLGLNWAPLPGVPLSTQLGEGNKGETPASVGPEELEGRAGAQEPQAEAALTVNETADSQAPSVGDSETGQGEG